MKITTDPMPLLRIAARDKIEAKFTALAQVAPHRDAARQKKRGWASGGQLDNLACEAALRGITPADLAQLILSKPDDVQDRENARQTAFSEVAAATTPAELDAIVNNLQLSI